MSGILDNKSRVIDAMLTFEGRRQMSTGDFVVKYVTFSDRSVVYKLDKDEGHVDPSTKIYLEAYNAPFDQITFEADDSGRLTAFRQHSALGPATVVGAVTGSTSWLSFVNGNIKSKKLSYALTGSFSGSLAENSLVGNTFASQLEGILTSSLDNFKNLRILGSADNLFEDYNFGLSRNEMEFSIEQNADTLQLSVPTNVNTIDSLFSDEKLRNVINFKYLPPIKKSTFEVDKKNIPNLISQGLLLGDYPPWGPIDPFTFSNLKNELSNYPYETVKFDPTSRDNEIVGQFFEIRNEQVSKLDVIDYGKVNNNIQNASEVTNHVFFVGKVFTDETGSDCFVHLFTLVFGPEEE